MQDSAEVQWLETGRMNRIREIRKAAGLSSDELGRRVGTTGATIRRIEDGSRELTAKWMQRIAEALRVTPSDLIATALVAEIADEVEAVEPDAVSRAIADRGLRIYRVLGKSVVRAGVVPGDVITVDETQSAIESMKGLEIVLVEVGGDRNKVLRQFVPPDMLIMNRGGSNLALSLEDPLVQPRIIGVVLRAPRP